MSCGRDEEWSRGVLYDERRNPWTPPQVDCVSQLGTYRLQIILALRAPARTAGTPRGEALRPSASWVARKRRGTRWEIFFKTLYRAPPQTGDIVRNVCPMGASFTSRS